MHKGCCQEPRLASMLTTETWEPLHVDEGRCSRSPESGSQIGVPGAAMDVKAKHLSIDVRADREGCGTATGACYDRSAPSIL